jgi:deazaflavin-dependent oxidoreductase (nitroreductase family)
MTAMTERKPFLPPRWFIRVAWVVHRALYKLSGGRLGLRPPTDTKYGMFRLKTIGRKSGEERIAILGYIEDGPRLVTMAMNGWAEPEPAWWLNLQAQPNAVVELPDGPREVTGRAATGDERSRLWRMLAQASDGLDQYATYRSRETAIVVLEPRTPNR